VTRLAIAALGPIAGLRGYHDPTDLWADSVGSDHAPLFSD
jgi:hypothetical protein